MKTKYQGSARPKGPGLIASMYAINATYRTILINIIKRLTPIGRMLRDTGGDLNRLVNAAPEPGEGNYEKLKFHTANI